jgi:hypothetical protein
LLFLLRLRIDKRDKNDYNNILKCSTCKIKANLYHFLHICKLTGHVIQKIKQATKPHKQHDDIIETIIGLVNTNGKITTDLESSILEFIEIIEIE